MEPVYCIPTYKRQGMISRKTLRVLQEQGVPSEKIFLYVADEDEKKKYTEDVPKHLYGSIVVSAPGLAESRNAILDAWPVGKHIVMMDDDVDAFVTKDASEKLVKGNLQAAVAFGFQTASEVGCCLWGIYPVANSLFMKHFVTTDLRFCVGPMFGMINPGGDFKLPMSEKEDYIRTLMAYDRDGAVVRINNVSVRTNFYKNPGGMKENSRAEKATVAVNWILERWPDRVTRKKAKTGYPEIRLKVIREKTTQVRTAPNFSS